jgi:hypothetical protein
MVSESDGVAEPLTAEDSDATPASSEIDSESESLNSDKESSSFAAEALEEETEVISKSLMLQHHPCLLALG